MNNDKLDYAPQVPMNDVQQMFDYYFRMLSMNKIVKVMFKNEINNSNRKQQVYDK